LPRSGARAEAVAQVIGLGGDDGVGRALERRQLLHQAKQGPGVLRARIADLDL